MKIETLEEQFKRVGKELEAVGFERRQYSDDFSLKGCQKWDELWARGEELLKQYNKLKEKINVATAPAAVQPTV